jgi:putative exporter of polyketide antibiotics
MRDTRAGTGVLLRLGLRRDRWLLPVWVAGFAVVAYSTARAGAELYPDGRSRIEAANALNATASMVAMFGRIYDPASLGALSLIKYTAFMTAILAVLMVVLVIRHTRADEESGRLELLAGGRLGRDAALAAALTSASAPAWAWACCPPLPWPLGVSPPRDRWLSALDGPRPGWRSAPWLVLPPRSPRAPARPPGSA